MILFCLFFKYFLSISLKAVKNSPFSLKKIFPGTEAYDVPYFKKSLGGVLSVMFKSYLNFS